MSGHRTVVQQLI